MVAVRKTKPRPNHVIWRELRQLSAPKPGSDLFGFYSVNGLGLPFTSARVMVLGAFTYPQPIGGFDGTDWTPA